MHHTSHSHFLNRSRSANVTNGVVVTTVLIKKQPECRYGVTVTANEIFFSTIYGTFHKHANSEVQKPTNDCVFRCRQSS